MAQLFLDLDAFGAIYVTPLTVVSASSATRRSMLLRYLVRAHGLSVHTGTAKVR